MGRIAATLRPTASVPTDGGLLLDPTMFGDDSGEIIIYVI